MIVCAACVDALDWLLGLGFFGFIINIPATFLFGIWLSDRGLSIMHPDRALKFISTIGAEMVPLVNNLPFWTITIYTTVMKEWRSTPEI